ncbi:MAG TPA: NADPH-dependent F420 reductase [Chloroflexi bacterium]|nr:NADPH-dependent F420 reductase [Chloroflexota bacterium]
MSQENQKPIIGIIGGTGKEGKGLAFRWIRAGYQVIIGSRTQEKAKDAVQALTELVPEATGALSAALNEDAAQHADVVILTVPFAHHVDMVTFLKPLIRGKILVDVTVPLVPPKVSMVQMPPEGSAAMQAQQILGEESEVVAAFQNISFKNLLEEGVPACDILVCGRKREAREMVLSLIESADMIGWDAGYLENSMVVEGLTSILIGLNKKYKVKSSGIKITGIPLD